MTTITSLKDLIQKISNDGGRTSRMFPFLKGDIEACLTCINEATSMDDVFFWCGSINGILGTLFCIGYISENEKRSLISEFNDLRDNRIEYIVFHIKEKTEEGD